MGAETPETPPAETPPTRQEQIEKAADSRAVKNLAEDLNKVSDGNGELTQKEKREFNRVEMKASRKAERQGNRAERFEGKSGKKADEKEQLAKDKAALFKKMEEASREQEDAVILKKLEEEILHADDPEPAASDTKDKENEKKPELVESMASKWEIILKGLAIDLANSAPDKDDTFAKFTYGLKGGLFRLLVAFSGSDATAWAKDLSTEQKQVLQDALGLKLVPSTDDDGKAILTVEWIDPIEDYQPPSKRIVAVFEKYLGKGAGDLKTAFDTIKPDMRLSALKTTVSTMTDADQRKEYGSFIAAMEAQGIIDEDIVLDAIKGEKGSKLLTEEENARVEAEVELESTTEGKMVVLVKKLKFEKKANTTVKDFFEELKTAHPEWTELQTSFETLFSSEDEKDISGVELSEFIEREDGLKNDPLNQKLYNAINAKLEETPVAPAVTPSPAPNSTSTVTPKTSETPPPQ